MIRSASILVLAILVVGAQAEPQQSNKESPSANELDALIRKLGSSKFAEREAAQRALAKIGLPAKPFLEAAAKSPQTEVARRAKLLLRELRDRIRKRAEVYVFGLYESRAPEALVEVQKTEKPIILVLCAYRKVTWDIRPAKGTTILEVIASGYHKQQVEGVDCPVRTFSYDERSKGPDGKLLYFFTYDHHEKRYPDMVAKIKQLTGKRVKGFQGRYAFIKVPFKVEERESE